jgi:pSer/pThr/pTyr-binding forkhead associated (FHA) protein
LEVVSSGAHIPLIDQPELLIGREDEISGISPDVDMTPHGGEEGGISRRHARLIHEGSAWFILDLDSTNGTYLNGVELQPKTRSELNDGDRVGMGDVDVIFRTG